MVVEAMAKRFTHRTVESAILEKTGLDVELLPGKGYWYFVPRGEGTDILDIAWSTSVPVMRLNSQSVKQWVEDFEVIWQHARDRAAGLPSAEW